MISTIAKIRSHYRYKKCFYTLFIKSDYRVTTSIITLNIKHLTQLSSNDKRDKSDDRSRKHKFSTIY